MTLRTKRTLAGAGLAFLFIAGMGTGVALDRWLRPDFLPPMVLSPRFPDRMANKFRSKLDLDDRQFEVVKAALTEAQEKMMPMFRQMHPRRQAAIQEARKKIMAVLDKRQQKLFQAMLQRRMRMIDKRIQRMMRSSQTATATEP